MKKILDFLNVVYTKITTEFKPKLMLRLTSGLGVVVLTALGLDAELVVDNVEKVFAAFGSIALMLGITGMGETKNGAKDE